MYIEPYIVIPLWIFAIFGFLYFLFRVFVSLGGIRKKKKKVYTLVISARNQEDAIEGMVRGLLLNAGLDSTEEKLLQIVLIDLGSGDRTPKIMESLCRDYSVVKLIKPEDLPGYLRSLL